MLPPIKYVPDFDEANHVYTWEGRRVRNVTGILDRAGMKCKFFRPEPHYKERGSAVHYCTQLLDRDELDTQELWKHDGLKAKDRQIRGFVEAYMLFQSDVRPTILLSESPLYSPHYDVAGTLDRGLVIVRRHGILDIKTGTLPDSTGPQTAGYASLLFDGEPVPSDIGRWGLRLMKTSKYKLKLFEDSRDYEKFESAAAIDR
jgi:hypothetical protein